MSWIQNQNPENEPSEMSRRRGRSAKSIEKVILVEQVHNLEDIEMGVQRFANGMLIMDEFVTTAASFGGSTVWWPEVTLTVLKRLSTAVRYTVLMDADVSIDGRAEAFTRAINPMNDAPRCTSRGLTVAMDSYT